MILVDGPPDGGDVLQRGSGKHDFSARCSHGNDLLMQVAELRRVVR